MLALNGTRSAHPCAVNTRRCVVLTKEDGVAPPKALIGTAPFRQDSRTENTKSKLCNIEQMRARKELRRNLILTTLRGQDSRPEYGTSQC
jgi:hypothetical protein